MAKVMIIEDSNVQALVMSDIVEAAGHEVVVMPSLNKSLPQMVKNANPDVVLLDLKLLGPDGKPVVDGFQICKEIKRVFKNQIGVIIVSASADEDSAEWAVLQGADGFLQKPFNLADLVEVMNDVLGRLAK